MRSSPLPHIMPLNRNMGDDDPKQAKRAKLMEEAEAARAVRQATEERARAAQTQLDLARQEEKEAFEALAAHLRGDVVGCDRSLSPFTL